MNPDAGSLANYFMASQQAQREHEALIAALRQFINPIEDIDATDWSNVSRVHDWRNYIDPDLRSLWGDLSEETRLVAYLMASERADNEEWE